MDSDNSLNKCKVCIEHKPKPCGMVIFGASGDLTHRKLIPALFSLFKRNLMPDNFFVLGCARTKMDDNQFREIVHKIVAELPGSEVADSDKFISRFFFRHGDYNDAVFYQDISKAIKKLDRKYSTNENIVFYLSVPPPLYNPIINLLDKAGLTTKEKPGDNRRRVVIEKPFGRDSESAFELSREIRKTLSESQIYRIDHYLGKETVQNILMLRFANAIFEPLWNRRYIDNIQITVAETIGVGHRAGYFEKTGLLRDMFQNHMLLLLSLIAMEPPSSFAADNIRNEMVKCLSAVKPFPQAELSKWIVRGQYTSGSIDNKKVPGYRDEEGISQHSDTETFVAAKIMIDNWRWKDVPYYLRSGKRLPRRVSEIAITFKKVPHSIFIPLLPENLSPNMLVLNVQPEEGISLNIQAKQPGPKLCMGDLNLHFSFKDVFGGNPPEAYDRLILDCLLGDQTLFIRQDTIDIAWSILTPILESWQKDKNKESTSNLSTYKSGTWGPAEADRLLSRDNRVWKKPGKDSR